MGVKTVTQSVIVSTRLVERLLDLLKSIDRAVEVYPSDHSRYANAYVIAITEDWNRLVHLEQRAYALKVALEATLRSLDALDTQEKGNMQ